MGRYSAEDCKGKPGTTIKVKAVYIILFLDYDYLIKLRYVYNLAELDSAAA